MVAPIPVHGMTSEYGAVKCKANGAIAAGEMVVIGTDGVAPAADSCTTGIFGYAPYAAVDNAAVIIYTMGVVTMDLATSYDPDPGDNVYAASSLTVDGGSSSDISVGVVVGTVDPAASTTASVLLHCEQSNGHGFTHA